MLNQIVKLRQLQLIQFQLSSLKYGLLKAKNADILEKRAKIKKVDCAKKS